MTIFKRWAQGFVELLVAFPVFLLIGAVFFPSEVLWIWLLSLPFYYLFGMITRLLFKEDQRKFHPYAGNILAAVMAFLMIGLRFSFVIAWGIGLFLFYRGIRFMEFRWVELFPSVFFWGGLFLHFFLYFIFRFLIGLNAYLPVLDWIGLINIVVSLAAMNIRQLKAASLPGKKEPVLASALLKQNWAMVSGLVLLILLVAGYRQIKDGFSSLARQIGIWLFEAITAFFQFLTGMAKPGLSEGQSELLEQLLRGVEGERHPILELIIDIVSVLFTTAALAVVLFILCKYLYRGALELVRLIKWAIEKGKGFESEKGYIDEQETVMSLKDISKGYISSLREWLAEILKREPKWEDLKNSRERIRFLYRRLVLLCIGDGYRYKKSLTPHETAEDLIKWDAEKARGADRIARLYEEARYGERDVEDAEIEKLKGLVLPDRRI